MGHDVATVTQAPDASAEVHATRAARSRAARIAKALVLFAVLLSAGLILDFTVGSPLATLTEGVLRPEFIVAAVCLEILIVRPGVGPALVIGLIAGAVVQLTPSVKLVDLLAEPAAAGALSLVVSARPRRDAEARFAVPALAAFATTVLSGLVYALVVALFVREDASALAVMAPVVLATGVANALIVGALYLPLKRFLKIER